MLPPKTFRYRSGKPDQAALEKRIKDICETRVRYGYRRVQVLLQREGWTVNHKKVRRIYNELGLQLRNKTPKRDREQGPDLTDESQRRSQPADGRRGAKL